MMHGRIVLLAAGSLTAIALGVAGAASPVHPLPHPLPEPAFLEPVPAGECTATNSYEQQLAEAYGNERSYGDACKRLHFVFGPIWAKPGQNDVLIEPVTIQKPAYDGYIVRFRPDLVDASGKPPGIEEIHLHHATWLNAYPDYGNRGIFFAAGEEKTIATFPNGYGMRVGAADTWLLLYMVHNAIQQPRPVWITYDVDYIAEEDAEALGIRPVKPIWLDVLAEPIDAPDATDSSGNPVFNVQRGFGSRDTTLFGDLAAGPGTNRHTCAWPRQNCARHDVYGNVTPQQGVDITGSVAGADWEVPARFAGTLIGIGGHLHPGGIRDEVSLVRPGVGERPIFVSDAVAWDRQNPEQAAGGSPAASYDYLTSWDFSMTVTGSTIGWKVDIRPGDILRLNAVYDSQNASWYENMGIVVALVSPTETELEDEMHGGPGVDVFTDNVILDPGFPTTAVETPGWFDGTCTPNLTGEVKRLCLRGQVTHSHMEEASRHGGPDGAAIEAPRGRLVNELVSAGFTYGEADVGIVDTTGIPQLKLGAPTRFWNADGPLDIWHTWTRCREPCSGPTGIAYPVANGGPGLMDFDSTEIGWGLFFSPASGQFLSKNKDTDEAIRDGLYWDFTPTQTGTFSLYCRIHPFMRGVFEVVE